jgi:hypothetical protein
MFSCQLDVCRVTREIYISSPLNSNRHFIRWMPYCKLRNSALHCPRLGHNGQDEIDRSLVRFLRRILRDCPVVKRSLASFTTKGNQQTDDEAESYHIKHRVWQLAWRSHDRGQDEIVRWLSGQGMGFWNSITTVLQSTGNRLPSCNKY